jgi:long-chain acyl-CoA synthetase
MTDPWTVENGLVTPTFKVRRNVLETRYAARLDAWTSTGRSIVWAD